MSAPRPTVFGDVGVASARQWLTGGRLLILLAALSLVIGLLSLSIPSTPSYDPWSWLLWGKQIVHGSLHTEGGPSWKPLPMIFTIPFALFGHLQPNLWLVVARAGAVMATLMCFRLAWRITHDLGDGVGEGAKLRNIAAAIAAVIAAGSFVNAPGIVSNQALGYSEGLAAGFLFAGFDRFLDGRRDWAFVLGGIAALDRPELWFLWIPYGIWLAWTDPSKRKLVIGLFVLSLLLWFGPTGTSGVTRAQHPRSNSAAFASCPLCTVWREQAWPMVLNRIKVPGIIAMLIAAGMLFRTRASWFKQTLDTRSRGRIWLIVMGLFGLGWWFGIGLETQVGGFSGNSRYLLFGTAAVGIAGGIAWGWLVFAVARALSWLRQRLQQGSAALAASVTLPVGAVASVGLFLAVPPWIGKNLISIPRTHRALLHQAWLRENLNQIVAAYGGADKIKACGQVMTEGFQVPMVAWTLGLKSLQVEDEPATIVLPKNPTPAQQALYNQQKLGNFAPPPMPNVILQARDRPGDTLLPLPQTILHWDALGYKFTEVAHINSFWLFTRCQNGQSTP